jgi:hypothetical protein
MAKLKGLVKIEGTIDELTFYKSKDGHLVRRKGGVNGTRIATEDKFQRTRENNAEFTMAAQAGKLLRRSLNNLLQSVDDGRIVARLTQVMHLIKRFDTTSVRGERKVGIGIQTTEGKSLLLDFDFNQQAILKSVLSSKFSADAATGIILIPDFNPKRDLSIPTGATHVTIKGACARIDFETGANEVEYCDPINVPIGSSTSALNLIPAAYPGAQGTVMVLLGLSFFQEMNGLQYPMNGSSNPLSIIAIS